MNRVKKIINNETLRQESFRKYVIVFCIILLISLFTELCVFNFRSVESLFNKEITDFEYALSYAEEKDENIIQLAGYSAQNTGGGYRVNASNVKNNGDGTSTVFVADSDDVIITSSANRNSDGTYTISNSRIAIEIFNPSGVIENLKNVKLDIMREGGDAYTEIRLWAVDEANKLGIYAPKREITDEWQPSEYIRTHFSGDVEKLRIYITGRPGENIVLNDLRLNCRVPVYFSVARFLFVLMLLMMLYLLRPNSFIHKKETNFKKYKWQLCTVVILLIAETAMLWGLYDINPDFIEPRYSSHAQYQELAESFLEGHTYLLDKKPSQELMNMENPYDFHLRSALGVKYEWDHAYRNGHYYVYFGIVPELVFYLPYKAITGNDLSNYVVVIITCMLICVGVSFLLYATVRRWFKRTPFGVYFITSLIMMNTCGILYMAKRPDFYSVPVGMAVMFAILGMAFWLFAENEEEHGDTRFKPIYLLLGSLCMALVAGCRPHILLSSFFAIALFWRVWFKKGGLFGRSSVKQTLALCLPYVVVAVGIMIYNYARFNSPFDFGANYNLTTNDMTQRGFVADRNLTGLFYYLLQPLTFTNTFPYIQMVSVSSLYQGLTLSEKMMGGLLWATPIIFFGIRGMFKPKWFSGDKRPYVILLMAMVFGAVIAMLDAQLAGILSRYYTDFSWILLYGATIAVFAEFNTFEIGECGENTADAKRTVSILLICILVSLIVFGLSIFNDVDNSIFGNNPWLYHKMKYLIGFLL